MKNDDLIKQLSDNLQPVKRLPSISVRTMRWLGFVIFWVALGLYLLDLRADWPDKVMDNEFIIESVLFSLAGLLSSIVAIALSVPGKTLKSIYGVLGAVSVALWVGLIIWKGFFVSMPEVREQLGFIHGLQICFTSVAGLALVPALFVLYYVRKAASCSPAAVGFFSVLAAASFATLGSRYFCDIDDHAHIFVWHFIPMMSLAIGGVLIGRSFLKW